MDDEFGDLSDLDVHELEFLSTQAAKPNPKPACPESQSVSLPEGQTDAQAFQNSIDEFDLLSDITIDAHTPVRPTPNPARRQQYTLVQTTLHGAAVPGSAEIIGAPAPEEPPTHHALNTEELRTWTYPMNLGSVRDYQYNIVQHGLFQNLLVALPTGLGKTFIAATIMLNWYRWTQSAQIIFVAPTKPLVMQQIDACFSIVGIPRSQTTVMTGGISPGVRAEEWRTKRVFFMTPQTLINDLKTGICDPKRIVLLVVDEAHRATGAYAYVEVVKFIARFNESFRVLALTATPGSTIEAVQEVIDGLRISQVEIRTEHSIDIRSYVHGREVLREVFDQSDEMAMLQELYNKALRPLGDVIVKHGAYWKNDPSSFTAYGLMQARQKWMATSGQHATLPVKNMVNAIMTLLSSLAHGMELLKYYGITPFFTKMNEFRKDTVEKGSKSGKYRRQVNENKDFDLMMTRLTAWTNDPNFVGHPKLEYLRNHLSNHFLDAGEGLDSNRPSTSSTKVIIFAHFRDAAEDIARVLKPLHPIVRPHVFVGQQSSKNSEGMAQKAQHAVMERFRSGDINTLIATSIGEEGLDIGQVDLIVCYDSKASPLRMLQRMGRTGRKRNGRIVLLQMRGKEEEDAEKAKKGYEHMQEQIARGDKFAYHEDANRRILPRDVHPRVDKRVVEIPVENTQVGAADAAATIDRDLRKRKAKRPPKKFHMPDGVETGFMSAAGLIGIGGTGKSPKTRPGRSQGPIDGYVKKGPGRSSLKPVTVPSVEEVVLTPAQRVELEVRYQQDSVPEQRTRAGGRAGGGGGNEVADDDDDDDDEITVGMPALDLHPKYQRRPAPSFLFDHAGRTRTKGGLAGLLARMDKTADRFGDVTERDMVDRWTGEEGEGEGEGENEISAKAVSIVVPSPRRRETSTLSLSSSSCVVGVAKRGSNQAAGGSARAQRVVSDSFATATAAGGRAGKGKGKPRAGKSGLKRTHSALSAVSGPAGGFLDMEASEDEEDEEEDGDWESHYGSSRGRPGGARSSSSFRAAGALGDLADDDDLPDLGEDLTKPSSDFGIGDGEDEDLDGFVVGDSDEEAVRPVGRARGGGGGGGGGSGRGAKRRGLKSRREQREDRGDIVFGTQGGDSDDDDDDEEDDDDDEEGGREGVNAGRDAKRRDGALPSSPPVVSRAVSSRSRTGTWTGKGKGKRDRTECDAGPGLPMMSSQDLPDLDAILT